MIKEAIGTGKTVEEALENAYAQLGANSDNSEFEILERPARKLFGLKMIPAQVKVTMEVPDEVKKPAAPAREVREPREPREPREARPPRPQQPKKKPQPAPEAPKAPKAEQPKAAPAQAAQPALAAEETKPEIPAGTPATGEKVDCAIAYLKSIFAEMGLETVEIKATAIRDGAVLTLSGEGLGVLIGRRGETLDALQYLAGLVANRLEGDYFRITIDSGNYRQKRERTLEQLARKLSGQVLKNGRSVTLEPMNPYERRIIHATVQTIEGVTSASTGEEPNRRVVISSTNPRRRAPQKDGGNRSGSSGNRGGRGRGGRGRGGNRPPRSGGNNTVTRPNAFGEGAAPKKIDDSAIEIEPPAIHREPKAAPKPQAPKNTPPAEVQGKPLYSKIELDDID